MRIETTTYDKNEEMIENYVLSNKITVDSYWEKHLLESNHYAVIDKGKIIGYFSIFKKHTLTSFYLNDEYVQYGQSIFEEIKHYEQVTNAMVSTGDEFFISHCVDDFALKLGFLGFSFSHLSRFSNSSQENIIMC